MIEQVGIVCTGVTAIWLSQHRNPERRRYACFFGLAGQPFWFYTTYLAEQWGVFAVCFLYTWAWWRGYILHWRAPCKTTGEYHE